jgi:hypothetical protein
MTGWILASQSLPYDILLRFLSFPSVSSSSFSVFLFFFGIVLLVVLVGVGWLLSRALWTKLEFGVCACDGVV